MQLCFANTHRQAVIKDGYLHCFTNRGVKQFAWRSVWPPIPCDNMRKLKRWAAAWVNKAKLPEVV